MKITWRTEWPHWVLLAAMFALAAASWGSAPGQVPVHWNLAGQVDRYGGRFEGVFLLPLVAAAIYLLMLWLPRLDPGRANYETFAGAYATLRLAVLAVLAGTYGVVQLWAHGRAASVAIWAPLLVGALLVVVGSLLGKLRPNWFVGIRTPWTLSSKVSWTRTHRLGGWLFIGLGVLTMTMAILGTTWAFRTMFAALVAVAIGLVVYSYRVWRKDPEKMPPAGTLPANGA